MKLYCASKLHHAKKWQDLWTTHPSLHITSRWIWLVDKLPDDPINAAKFWLDDLADVVAADAVLCYGEPEDNLRGALIEAGVALGMGKTVYVVGENDNFGTWQYHPLVDRSFSTLGRFLAFKGGVR